MTDWRMINSIRCFYVYVRLSITVDGFNGITMIRYLLGSTFLTLVLPWMLGVNVFNLY